jgi:hypothetical protein
MDFRQLLGEPAGQTWVQLAELTLAFVLSASIGLEREIRQKSAGLRTYTLVGFSSALVMLVSKYGFTNILESGRVVLDPSRLSLYRAPAAEIPLSAVVAANFLSRWAAVSFARCWRVGRAANSR